MTYSLEFEEHTLKEFKKLAPVLRDQFKKKLATVLENPVFPPIGSLAYRIVIK
jgi:mRNA interferase RelE/StbE